MQKWEYKQLWATPRRRADFFSELILPGVVKDEQLNKLGEEGWELAGVVATGEIDKTSGFIDHGSGGTRGGGGWIGSALIFKRPKL